MEPGSKKPTLDPEECWVVPCPVPYCGAQPGSPCMTPRGLFALNTHLRRKEAFLKPSADHFGKDRPRSEMQERAEFQQDLAEGKRPLTEFFADTPGFVVTDKKRDKFTLEDEDFDPWWEEEDENDP